MCVSNIQGTNPKSYIQTIFILDTIKIIHREYTNS